MIVKSFHAHYLVRRAKDTLKGGHHAALFGVHASACQDAFSASNCKTNWGGIQSELDIQRIVNSTINLSFRYAEGDYVRALRAHYATHLRLRIDIIAIVVLVGVGACLLRWSNLHWCGLTCIIVAIAFGLLLVAAFTVIPPLAFRREPKLRDDYSLTFSPEGIQFRTANVNSQLQWSMYLRALIDAPSYVLYYGARQFTLIPKRVFQSAEQRQAFEQLLTQRISQIVRRDQV